MPLVTTPSSENLAFLFVLAQFPQFRFSQMVFLAAIESTPGISHSELAAQLGVTASALSRNVDVFGSQKGRDLQARQHNHGFLEVRKTPGDDRIKTLYLTAKGQNFLNTFREILNGNPA
jgi:DNA-binding MarR family transcriptional regulator